MQEVVINCKLLRNYAMSDFPSAEAKLLIKILPDTTIDYGSLPVNIAMVIDVSNSMAGRKIRNAKSAAKQIVDLLKPEDTLSLTIFGDEARVIIPSSKAVNKAGIKARIDKINTVGGTRMYHGLESAYREIRKTQTETSINRVIVLTDGETEGEERCMTIATQELANRFVLTAFGIGIEYNDSFLKRISSTTLGSFFHLKTPEQTSAEFKDELHKISAERINKVSISINTVQDVSLKKVYRLLPELVELTPEHDPSDTRISVIQVGNIRSNDDTVFGAEFELPSRSPGRVRIAQVIICYSIPGLGVENKSENKNVIVEYTHDRDLCKRMDNEVLLYFNQQATQDMLNRAINETQRGNISRATEILQQAQVFTHRIGNVQLTRSIGEAMEELKDTGRISPGSVKTVRAGSGHTVRIDDVTE